MSGQDSPTATSSRSGIRKSHFQPRCHADHIFSHCPTYKASEYKPGKDMGSCIQGVITSTKPIIFPKGYEDTVGLLGKEVVDSHSFR